VDYLYFLKKKLFLIPTHENDIKKNLNKTNLKYKIFKIFKKYSHATKHPLVTLITYNEPKCYKFYFQWKNNEVN